MATRLSSQMVPMLDGVALTRDRRGRLFHNDGREVAASRVGDVVFVTSSEGEAPLDLAAALAGIAPPRDDDAVDAGFFHRTLARWLGLPEGSPPTRKRSSGGAS